MYPANAPLLRQRLLYVHWSKQGKRGLPDDSWRLWSAYPENRKPDTMSLPQVHFQTFIDPIPFPIQRSSTASSMNDDRLTTYRLPDLLFSPHGLVTWPCKRELDAG
jgi:hypothetical protein